MRVQQLAIIYTTVRAVKALLLGDSMYKHKRGVIKESAVKAILHDPLFSQKVEKPKKGKGSYRRVKPSAYL